MNLVEQNQFLQQHNCLTFTSTMCPDIIEANYVEIFGNKFYVK